MHLFTFYLIIFLVVLSMTYILMLVWKRRHWYIVAQQFDGPTAFPIIGNSYLFICKNEDVLMRLLNLALQYIGRPFRFWLGPILVIILPNPSHVEKILSSSKFSQKHDIYKFAKYFLGKGLITESGPMHKRHRRIIQPMFDLNFVKESASCMQTHVTLCMQRLEHYVNKGNFDFFHAIHPCFADVIKEIILGSDDRSQVNGTSKFDQAMSDAYYCTFVRMISPWLHPDILFNMTPLKRKYDEIKQVIRSQGQSMIEAAFQRKELLEFEQDFHPIIDKIANYVVDNPDVMDKETFVDHVLTLYTAAEDTLSINSAFLAMLLGMYPEIQDKAAEEVRNIFGDTPRLVTADDIPKLHYVEMCIKEILRLFPIGPFILRKCTEDYQLDDKWTIPEGCAITIPVVALHRDPNSWEKPNEFYPEHFLPEAEKKRHVFSYLPFSAGSRGCIGKTLAYNGLKLFAANLLQRYEVETDGKIETLRIKMDISTRPTDGCFLRLKDRIWK